MDPLVEYTARRDRFRSQEQILEKQFVAIGNWRLVTALGAAVLAWFVFARHAVTVYALLLPLAIFVGLVLRHQRVSRKKVLAARGVRYYERGVSTPERRMAGNRKHGGTVSGQQPRLRRRPGFVRERRSLRTHQYSTHGGGRKHAGTMAAGAGSDR